jgi:very-short-patch-repair endonuclease
MSSTKSELDFVNLKINNSKDDKFMKPYNKNLKQPSRDLRSNMTNAEQLLWQRIRRKQILELQFYIQKPILNFIVDFYCPTANLVIECDGGQHYTAEGLEADQNRDQTLSELGVITLRFSNLMCAELAGDFHLGDSRQLTDKSLLPFDLVS